MSARLELSGDCTVDLFLQDASDHVHAKMIPGRQFMRGRGAWRLPLSSDTLRAVTTRFASVHVDPEILRRLDDSLEKSRRVRELKDADIDVASIAARMPIRVSPYRHQVRAFAIALELLA